MTDPVVVSLDDFRGIPVTEDMAARRFAILYDEKLVFDHSRGKWFRFNGSTWALQETPIAFHYARELCRQLSAVSVGGAGLQKVRFSSGVETFARADPIFARTFRIWDNDPYLLGTPGGTVDLKTGNLRSSVVSEYISKSTTVVPDEFIDCPHWLRFLEQATNNDREMQHYLQQIAGYALTGDTSEQCLFFLHGDGGRGKGTFVNTLHAIMGDYAIQSAMETFEASRQLGHSTSIAMLRGARLVTASETEEGRGWNEARIKNFTGEDPITARFMRQDDFTFMPQFKLVIIGNHQPSLRTVDDAMRRRFNMIPFTVKPTRADHQLRLKLAREYPGILRWAIDGCLDWRQHGFIRPQSVIDATAEYFESQNTFGRWLEEYCTVDHARHGLQTSAAELFASWTRFAKANGEDAGQQKNFGQALTRHHFEKKHTMSGAVYLGIALIDFREPRGDEESSF